MSDLVARRLKELSDRVKALERQEHVPGGVAAHYMLLPGLRGLWTMTDIDENGDCYDLSGEGHTLSYNGNPTYNVDGLAPYIDFDGTGDYLSLADTGAGGGFDVLGTESFIAAGIRGLTVGGWFYINSTTPTVNAFIAKWAVSNKSFMLCELGGGVRFYMSSDGSTNTDVVGTSISADAWTFVVGRFNPSTEMAVWVNTSKTTDTTSIPASIYDGNAAFNIGYDPADSSYFNGRASLCFVCAAALSDTIIGTLYQRSRVLFGV